MIVSVFIVVLAYRKLCPDAQDSYTYSLVHSTESTTDYNLYACGLMMVYSASFLETPTSFCGGTLDINAGSLDAACICSVQSDTYFSDNTQLSIRLMFYVAFVLTNIVVIFQIAVNLRCYRKLVLELRCR